MNQFEHKKLHKNYHHVLDLLVVDWLYSTGKSPSEATILDLMMWSYGQSINPDAIKEQGGDK